VSAGVRDVDGQGLAEDERRRGRRAAVPQRGDPRGVARPPPRARPDPAAALAAVAVVVAVGRPAAGPPLSDAGEARPGRHEQVGRRGTPDGVRPCALEARCRMHRAVRRRSRHQVALKTSARLE